MTETSDLFTLKRNFFVLAHRVNTDGNFNLNDLCGSAGRLDGIIRSINSSLFLSHGIRRDSAVHAIMMGPSDPPKVLSILGSSVRYLNPDERSTASLIKKALEIALPASNGSCIRSTPGIYVTRGGLDHVLDNVKGRSFLLLENADKGRKILETIAMDVGNINFFLSDDRDFEEEEIETIMLTSDGAISVSPKVLHTDHCITVIHSILDDIEN
ncbi:MAG: tRNA (pseudouridine(54)-N(1))-methyltransferase TrmY [Candidatus Thermoplasmatota archaeon]|nr:tRNA (pseudouridine(54)-N(1))-methyltransferase TrmY [Candidatus Thermoplasmatota archaeon]